MREFSAVTLLFALRCVVPLLITFAIGYAASRLYSRWEIEAGVKPRVAPRPALRPSAGPSCWTVYACRAGDRARCPAYQHPHLACWAARMLVEGALPAKCPTCRLFAPVETTP